MFRNLCRYRQLDLKRLTVLDERPCASRSLTASLKLQNLFRVIGFGIAGILVTRAWIERIDRHVLIEKQFLNEQLSMNRVRTLSGLWSSGLRLY